VGSGLGNYTISYVNGTLTVNPAALTITASSTSKTYGQTVTFAGTEFTASGLLNGDAVTSIMETSTGAPASATVAGSPYPIVASAAVGSGLGNYTINYVNGALTVNPAPLTITANNANKTYGQTASFAGTAFTTSGLVNGDNVARVTETSPGSGPAVAVGPYNIVPSAATFSAGLGSNYTITYANGTLTVNPAPLTIMANNASKAFGQTATFPGTAFLASGLVGGDTVSSVTETSTGSPATAPVGTYPIVPSNATFSVGQSGNYTITYANGTLTVNSTAITVGSTTNPSVYGQSLTFTVTVAANSPGSGTPTGTVQFQIDGVNFGTAVALSGGLANSGATSALAAGNHAIQALYSGDGNFAPGTGTLTQTVNPAALTITANDASKTYGQTATYAADAFTTSGLVNGDTVSGVTETSTGSDSAAAIGTDPIVPSNAMFSAGQGTNYTITYANGTLMVDPAPLTITADSRSKTYGQTVTFAGPEFTTSGLVGGDTVSSVTETSPGAAATATVAGSPYPIIPGTAVGTGLSNYTISYVNGTLTVDPAPLTITANNASKIYGQTASLAGTAFTTSGLLNADTVTSVTETSTGAAVTATVAGSPYAIIPGAAVGSGVGNYAIAYVNGTLTLNPAPLTITANDASKAFGQTATFPGTAFLASGLVGGDTVSSVTETSTGSDPAAAISTYPIVPSNAIFAVGQGSNYTISYVNGTLTVNSTALAITVSSTTSPNPSVYGQPLTFTATVAANPPGSGNPTGTVQFQIDGANFGSPVALAGGMASSGATTALAAGNHSIQALYGGDANFGPGTGTLTQTVNPAALLITANSASKTYGQTVTFAGTEFTTSGLVGGDTVSSVTETSAGAPAAATVAGSPYAIIPGAAVGTGLGNYTISYANGTLTVNPAPLLITANSASKTYGQTAAFDRGAFSASGLVNGDTLSSVPESSAGAAATAAAGTYPIVPGGAVFSSGQGSSYTISYANGTLTVNPAAATQLIITSPPPGSVAVGGSFGLTVKAVDSGGNLATSFNGPITVTLASDPGGATLDGTLTATATNGVATFSNLALDKAGSGATLQLSGGGLGVTSGAIATTGATAPAPHQILPTSQKQKFHDLAMTYAQRAARLTAIAATTPAPFNNPLNELAAYYWDESLTDAAIADDPPDTNFTTVAPVQNATVPPLSPGGGITQAEADTFNALFAEQAQALGLAQAISTALNRAQAAAVDPADAASEQLQLNAVTMFSQQLGQVTTAEPGLLANVQAALAAGGVADVSVSASDVQALQQMAAGALPAGLENALQQLASSDSQLQSIQLPDIQAALAAQDPAATAGSLAATLTDPAFKAQVQSAAQVLTATVVLSGSLSPANVSVVSNGYSVTNAATPTFVGTAPPGTTVQLFAQSEVSSAPVLIGTAVADPSSHWQIMANHLADATYAISARFSGGASGFGQVTPLTQISIETVAPRITAISYSRNTGKVTITFDAPAGFNPAKLTNPAFYVARTKGANSPLLKISGIQRVGMQVTFTVAKGRSHPSSFYLDVVSGGIQDLAGNALDGEFNGTFPTGNGHPGDFSHTLPIVIHRPTKARKAHRK
jgi:hypothetical protein